METYKIKSLSRTPNGINKRFHDERSVLDVYFSDPAFKSPQLTEKEKIELLTVLHGSGATKTKEEAKEKLIYSSLRLVVLISKDYEHLGLDKMDLISEGNLGLIKAIERYDVTKVCKFSYYAGLWIRQRMIRALEKGARTIRVPNPIVQLKINIEKFKEKRQCLHGKKPSENAICKYFKITKSKLKKVQQVELSCSSLNVKLLGDGPVKNLFEFGDLIEDTKILWPNIEAEKKETKSILRATLNKLSERERKIICFRFGLDNLEEETLDNIGKRYRVTRERIRQIEALTIKKIKKIMEKQMEISIYEK